MITPHVKRYIILKTRDAHPLFVQCFSSVGDGGPAVNQQSDNISCSLAIADFSFGNDVPRTSNYYV